MKLAAAAVFASFAVAALAEEPPAPAPATASATAPTMSAEDQAMMEKYMKAAMPGPEHQAMAKMAGKWNLQVSSWMKPGMPPMKSGGTAEFKTIMDGRFLEQEVHGDMAGQKFEGHGLEGYDNVTKMRWGTWVDNMGTGTMMMKGKCAAAAKSCTTKGKVPDPVSGKEVMLTSTVTMKDDNTMVMEMSGPGQDGKPFKNLEIVYTRAQ